ncbi:hypothetical protein, partial [uncultured Desulfovibrio sp.]|uniref:hypothetical protein n=1 Tax=uncultured Desulfovibrio sp. TaxID=167968 RepID=UPI002805E549
GHARGARLTGRGRGGQRRAQANGGRAQNPACAAGLLPRGVTGAKFCGHDSPPSCLIAKILRRIPRRIFAGSFAKKRGFSLSHNGCAAAKPLFCK